MLKYEIDTLISKINLINNKLCFSYLIKKHIKFFLKNRYNSFFKETIGSIYFNYILKEKYKILYNNSKLYATNNKIYNTIDKCQIMDSYLFVFVNGKYYKKFSKFEDISNFSFSEINTKTEDKILNTTNKFDKFINIYKYNTFYSINIILSKEGVYIKIPNNIILKKPIEILHILTDIKFYNKIMLNYRNLILVGKNSHVKIIEHYKYIGENTSFIVNLSNSIYSNNDSNVKYYKIQDNDENVLLLDSTFLKHKQNSTCTVYTFSLCGKSIKNNLNIFSLGKGTYSYLYGISILSENKFVSNHTVINHLYSNSNSYQLYKNILFNKSKCIFNGKIIINKFIKRINSFQKNNNILFSKESNIYSKPQLEISSKDVKCSHGCTVGNIQDSEMFYLQSRGISRKESKILLLLSFLEELIRFINFFEIQILIQKKINKKLDKFL